MSAGNLIELAAATNDIDTADQLTMASAFQKVFIANGANLKIADFINVKLTHAALGTPHARGDILTQNTNNKMIVDFTNTTKTATYGYVTAGVWDVTNAVTGSGSGSGFTPTGINGKLTHAALTTAHSATDTLTQDNTGATMVVEYADAAKTHTYGRITGGTFNTTDVVHTSGSGDDPFTPTATDTSPTVYYDWTVYQGDTTTYGTMPEKAYLICIYRGRVTLSGNPQYPNQWYMSKVADPFNFKYGADDPMSAVAGNNADAGQCPDIPRALISFHDDYLIFGCASTIWILRGDPVAGGSLDNLSDTTGIFGSNSWCFDDSRNLYFWGSGGLYEIKSDFSGIRNLTEMVLPDIINDEAADPSTHRITMGYDKKRHGLVITITKLADGSNSNYFYSFKTEGFYPESYPDECGSYSLFYYDANDTTYADLLVGCKDGFLRKFSTSAKDDNVGATTDAINSYVVYPITSLSDKVDMQGKVTGLVFEPAGGGEGGSFNDTDGFTWHVYAGNDAEAVLEKTKATTAWADATNYAIGSLVTYSGVEYICIVAHLSATGAATHEEPDTNTIDWKRAMVSTGTVSGPGRTNKIRPAGRGAFMALKLSNSNADETFAINRTLYSVKPVGRVRG